MPPTPNDSPDIIDTFADVLTEPVEGVDAVMQLIGRFAYPDLLSEAELKLTEADIRAAIAGLVAGAVAAERERAAKIAEDKRTAWTVGPIIAAAIRGQTT